MQEVMVTFWKRLESIKPGHVAHTVFDRIKLGLDDGVPPQLAADLAKKYLVDKHGVSDWKEVADQCSVRSVGSEEEVVDA